MQITLNVFTVEQKIVFIRLFLVWRIYHFFFIYLAEVQKQFIWDVYDILGSLTFVVMLSNFAVKVLRTEVADHREAYWKATLFDTLPVAWVILKSSYETNGEIVMLLILNDGW